MRLASSSLEGTMLVLSLEDVPKTELDLDQDSMPVVVGGTAASKEMTQ